MNGMHVGVIGAGVAGLVAAHELARHGARVDLFERGNYVGERACAWFAGGMLAPWCERESAEPAVLELGRQALAWWPQHVPDTACGGTLVVAPRRDTGELDRFARRTSHYRWLDGDGLGALEPALAGRFGRALHFADEAHLDPRRALATLAEKLRAMGVSIHLGVDRSAEDVHADAVLDCRGLAAREALEELRGVRGEMALLRSRDIVLSRPVRLLHPRFGLYVIPRTDGIFMIGATMLESASSGPVTARSAVELLNAAYALHPAFGEAEILELGVGVRPAFPDNLPRLVQQGRTFYLNGLHRHGFLLAPALAGHAVHAILGADGGEPA